MGQQIIKEVNIRLADGRPAKLRLIQLANGKLKAVLFVDDTIPEVLISRDFDDEKEAQGYWRYQKEEMHVPEPAGKYKKLAGDLRKAAAYALERMGDDDGGCCNFDAVRIRLPRWQEKLVTDTAKTAQMSCLKTKVWGRACYLFNLDEASEGYTRTKAAEALCDYLRSLGYEADVFYMLD